MKNHKMMLALMVMTLAIFTLGGCGNGKQPVTNPDGMKKVGSLNVEQEVIYTDESEKEEVIAKVSSADGLCVIETHNTYYDVTLDYERGTPSQVGAAYAEAILKARPDYEEILEPYLYENVRSAFN